MELQSSLIKLTQADYAVFAISYDPVSDLAAFAEKHGVTYPLLSDEGSHVIRRLGLYNEHLEQQAAHYGGQARDHQRGIPYPGTFVLDHNGLVSAKRFEQGYRPRPVTALLVADAAAEAPVEAAASELAVEAWLDSPTYRPYQMLRAHVRLRIPPGQHVYGRPIPDGYTPLSVTLEPAEGLVAGETELPPPRPFPIADGGDEHFVIHEGELTATIPFRIEANPGPSALDLLVAYQACTDTLCHPPAELRLRLPIEGRDLIRD